MEATADYYATLGVGPEADSAAIRVAYRNLMRRYHPDVNKSDEAIDRAMAINEAYACLSDPDARASYDWRRGGSRSNQGAKARTTWQPPPPYQPEHQWGRRDHDLMADLSFLLQPQKWNWLNLSLAVVITASIFTATSFVSPIVPAPAEAVQVDLQPAAISCGERRQNGEAGTECTQPAATATR